MPEYEQKEKYTGTWRGEQVSFTRTFRGKRLSDSECEKLCAGDELEVRGLKSKAGGTYGVVVKLDNLEYNGHEYVGVSQLHFIEEIPEAWCQHKFTDDEKLLLESGHRVELTGCISKAGNKFDVPVTWERDEDGRMKIVPHFNK